MLVYCENCTLTYVAWAHPATEIILQTAHEPVARITHYKNGTEWELMGYTCRSRVVSYGEIGDWYEVSYYVAFQRKPFYYIISLTVPSFFITNLALIGLFSPSSARQERSEKTSIGLTALLTMAVILMMVSDLMPKNATSFPKLGTFILWEMTIMAASTVTAVVIMYLHSGASMRRPVPCFLRWLVPKQRQLAKVGPEDDQSSMEHSASAADMEHVRQAVVSRAESASFLTRLAMERVGIKLANYADDDDSAAYRLRSDMSSGHKWQSLVNNPSLEPAIDEDDENQLGGGEEQRFYANWPDANGMVLGQMLAQLQLCQRRLSELWRRVSAEMDRERRADRLMDEWMIVCYRLDIAMMFIALSANSIVTYLFSIL